MVISAYNKEYVYSQLQNVGAWSTYQHFLRSFMKWHQYAFSKKKIVNYYLNSHYIQQHHQEEYSAVPYQSYYNCLLAHFHSYHFGLIDQSLMHYFEFQVLYNYFYLY